jgi:diguanylate cyclase (GGDEF) domain protein
MRWIFSFWELHDKIRKTRRIKGKVRPRAVRGRMRFEKRMAMEALRRLLYAEMSREEYKACLPDIQRSNRQRVTAYLGIACAFLTVLWILSGALEFLRPNMLAYMIALAVCMGLQAVNRAFPGKNGLLLTWLMYAFEALLYVLGIYLGIHPSPDAPTVSFIAFLLAVPLLFVMRPIQHILNVVFFDGIFILTCFLFKSKETLPVDILDGMVFGAVSCIISTFIMLSMHENFSIRHKLLGIAETDLNVGLKNRNAYESQMHDYPMHCSSTLSCVYLDVNGLHELNNTRGHAAGDEMLKTVAAKVRDIFGEEYSYRVGGDEFVAFAMDKSAEEMRALIHKLVQEVDEAGYSVAVGTATHSAGGIDMEVLVKSAETRMYLAKEEHYRLAGKTRG